MSTGSGTIPPAGSVLPAPRGAPQIKLKIKSARINHRLHGLAVELETNRSTVSGIEVELRHGKRQVASARVAHVSTKPVRVVLREHRKAPPAGRYELIVRDGRQVMAQRQLKLH
jgi:hypothetical protein